MAKATVERLLPHSTATTVCLMGAARKREKEKARARAKAKVKSRNKVNRVETP